MANLTDFQASVLQEIQRLEYVHRKTPRPPYGRERVSELLAWDDMQAHGPRIANLFGGMSDNTELKRLHRALGALAEFGLVELSAARGENKTHARTVPLETEAA